MSHSLRCNMRRVCCLQPETQVSLTDVFVMSGGAACPRSSEQASREDFPAPLLKIVFPFSTHDSQIANFKVVFGPNASLRAPRPIRAPRKEHTEGGLGSLSCEIRYAVRGSSLCSRRRSGSMLSRQRTRQAPQIFAWLCFAGAPISPLVSSLGFPQKKHNVLSI
jgi:hypothetical protein